MSRSDFDVIVVGAGFAGLYVLHSLREAGYSGFVISSAAATERQQATG